MKKYVLMRIDSIFHYIHFAGCFSNKAALLKALSDDVLKIIEERKIYDDSKITEIKADLADAIKNHNNEDIVVYENNIIEICDEIEKCWGQLDIPHIIYRWETFSFDDVDLDKLQEEKL